MKLLKQDVTCMEKCVCLFYFEIVLFFMLKPVCFFMMLRWKMQTFFSVHFLHRFFLGGNSAKQNLLLICFNQRHLWDTQNKAIIKPTECDDPWRHLSVRANPSALILKFHACPNMSGLSVDRYKLPPDPFLRHLKTPVNPD